MSDFLAPSTPTQQALFEAAETGIAATDLGYRGPTACAIAGISYRQLDYWARTELIEPSIQTATGSGSLRLYSFTDLLLLKIVKKLLDAGVSLQNIRSAVEHLRNRGNENLANITLMSDGASVYECLNPEDVIDIVKGGQAVFGIAIGSVWNDIAGDLALLPNAGETISSTNYELDELSARRTKRATA